ncbi:MAG: hypothetical protein JOZ96_23790 [Acidobacteria bacterium]|nr:hypothetical protein [Acidobacteriota bacterium]
MINKSGMPYQFQSYVPGVFVEIYLPKKAMYQGMLYESLIEGFDFQKVREHFLDESKRAKIYQLLKDYDEVKNIEERIDKIEPFYWGYSMYEVDGVFFDPQKGIDEERTQVVRITFLPNLEAIQKLAPEMEPIDLRRAVKRILKADRDEREGLKERHPQVVDYLNKWKGDLGLFLFGYIIFKLCLRINEAGAELEKEIWLTSFWDIEVNKVKLIQSEE